MNLVAYWQSLPRNGWSRHAACKGMDREKWFDGHFVHAKEVCSRCFVADDCLAFALAHEVSALDRYGVYGGMTPWEREKFVRQLEAA